MAAYVVDHRDEWADEFEAERQAVADALGPLLTGPVEHIGSTAIPGMPAKPIIDMMAAVADPDRGRDAAAPLASLGYHPRPHRSDAVLYVRSGDGRDTHHLHLTAVDSALWRERLAFRDAVRRSPELHEEYRALKRALLARRPSGYLGPEKRDFVRRVLRASGVELADGLHVDRE